MKSFNIEHKVLSLLGVEQSEEAIVKLLLLQSFFIGVFYAVFDIAATSLFLQSFEASMTSYAFLVSGFIGLLATSIYSTLLRKINFSNLLVGNFIFIIGILIIIQSGFYISDSKWLAFTAFIMMGPLNLVALVGFWGMVGRLFTLRQGKRLFGMIDSGQIFGMILVSFAVPSFLLKWLNYKTQHLIFISIFSIIIAFIVQFFISTKYKTILNLKLEKVQQRETNSHKKRKDNLFGLFRQRYIRLMALFVIFSMITAFFIFSSFLAVSDIKYPNNAELTGFLGTILAILMVIVFLFKTFIYSKFINTYGLKAGLLIQPFVLGVFAIISATVGIFFGYSGNSQGFILFFLLMVLSRLMSVSIKSSIEVPSFKILYQSLDFDIRHRVQAGIDGVINEFAALISGAILIVLGWLNVFDLIHYIFVLIFIILIWIRLTLLLHKEYKKVLIASVSRKENDTKEKTESNDTLIQNDENSIEEPLHSTESMQLRNLLNYYEYNKPLEYEAKLLELLRQYTDEEAMLLLLNKVNELLLISSLPLLKDLKNQNYSESVLMCINDSIIAFEKLLKEYSNESTINIAINNGGLYERQIAARLIFEGKSSLANEKLAILLRDINPEVKNTAIKASSKLQLFEVSPYLIELLANHRYNNLAFSALIEMGEQALDYLEQGFYKTSQETEVLLSIIQIIGAIGGNKAHQLLLGKLTLHNKTIILAVLKSLSESNFKPQTTVDTRVLNQLLLQNIANTAFNINLRLHLDKIKENQYLAEALDEEIVSNYEILYSIMSLLYEKSTMNQIRSSIELGSNESISFAIELLEIFVDEEIKPQLFPLLEDLSDAERIRRLQTHFPLSKHTALSLLEGIINRDNNYIGIWTKACALKTFNTIEEIKPTFSLKAQMFNNNPLLRENAASILYQSFPKDFDSCLSRLEPRLAKKLSITVQNIFNGNTLSLFERIIRLREIDFFAKIPRHIAIEIISLFQYSEVSEDTELFSNVKSKFFPLFVVLDGEIVLKKQQEKIKYWKNNSSSFENINSAVLDLTFYSTRNTTFYYINPWEYSYILWKYSAYFK